MRCRPTLTVVLAGISGGTAYAAAPLARNYDTATVTRLVADARARVDSTAGQAGDTRERSLADMAGYVDGRIELADIDEVDLQRIMNALARDPCPPSTLVSCGWRVISLENSEVRALTTIENDRIPAEVDDPPLPSARFSKRVPAGFESLAARRRTDVDVYVENELALRTRINHDSATFAFEDPFAVTDAADRIGLPDRIAFERFVGLDHPIEEADLCVDDGPRDCLTGEPATYAFLPDLAARRVDLLARNRAPVEVNGELRRLPPATDHVGLQATARAAAVAVTSQGAALDAGVGGSASYGAGAFFASTSYGSTDETFRLNDAYLVHQYPDHLLRLGTLEYFSDGLLLNQRLLGASWGRSLNTYIDQRALYVTPIEVFLERRAVVQLAIEGVVRHSETLDAGLALVDTSNLPNGTHDVEIRIRDALGLRVETIVFSRALSLPPPQLPQYGLTVGSSLEPFDESAHPAATGDSFLSANFALRLGQQAGARIELTRAADTSTAQLQLVRLGSRYQLEADALVGERSALGGAVRAAWRGENLIVSAQALSFTSDRELVNDESLNEFLRPDTRSVGMGLRYRFGRHSLSLRTDRSRESTAAGTDERDRHAALIERRLASGALRGSTLGAQYVDDGDRRRAELRFTLFGRDGDIGSRGSVRVQHRLDEAEQRDVEVSYSAIWDPEQARDEDARARWTARLDTTASRSRSTLGASARYVGRNLDLGIAADATDAADSATDDLTWRSLVTAATQLASDGRRTASGRPSGQSAGVIIDVDGEPKGSAFDIVVNGQQRDVGEIGTKRFVGLAPYRTHTIELVPRRLAFDGLDEIMSTHVLYPGNVQSMTVDQESRYLLVTTFVTVAGEPIRDAIIAREVDPYFILEDGIVQIEVRPFEQLDIDLGGERTCRVEAPEPGEEDIVIRSEPLLCL